MNACTIHRDKRLGDLAASLYQPFGENMSDLAFKSALELAAMIRNREISSAEVTTHYIERIEKLDSPDLNAVPVRVFERARKDADRADAAVARGEELGPLHGVPMTIKESYVMRDTPTTWGLDAFRNNIGRADGIAVSRFRAAGAHFLGKTNVPANLADFQTYNPLYGTTGNPWDIDRTPGGSSGGSAAALAAGLSALDAGSDIGGSIRNPAHFCGVYGHKPTWGIVPMAGHELLEHTPDADLSVCGPLARSADDLALALDTMAGAPGRERRGWRHRATAAGVQSSYGDLRVAVWPDDDLSPCFERDRRPRGVGRRGPRTSRREGFRHGATAVRRQARSRHVRQPPEFGDVLGAAGSRIRAKRGSGDRTRSSATCRSAR